MQKEREAREARQLDREIRAQERHFAAETKKKEAAELHKLHQAEKLSQIHTQLSQTQVGTSSERTSTASTSTPPTKSPRDSIERAVIVDGKLRLPSIDKDKIIIPTLAPETSKSDTVKVI